ncbi:hypothetical protein MRB53_039432 [Persea americana]|nr:hypothetical protein MRB53_039432 [Persea americana]
MLPPPLVVSNKTRPRVQSLARSARTLRSTLTQHRRPGWLGDLSDLLAGTDDPLPAVGLVLDVLVLRVGALPDLDLTPAADERHAHRRQEVVRGVGVLVDAAVEGARGVLAHHGVDHGLAAGVVEVEVRDVVDDAGDGDELAPVLDLVDVVVPLDDGEGLERHAQSRVERFWSSFFCSCWTRPFSISLWRNCLRS